MSEIDTFTDMTWSDTICVFDDPSFEIFIYTDLSTVYHRVSIRTLRRDLLDRSNQSQLWDDEIDISISILFVGQDIFSIGDIGRRSRQVMRYKPRRCRPDKRIGLEIQIEIWVFDRWISNRKDGRKNQKTTYHEQKRIDIFFHRDVFVKKKDMVDIIRFDLLQLALSRQFNESDEII